MLWDNPDYLRNKSDPVVTGRLKELGKVGRRLQR